MKLVAYIKGEKAQGIEITDETFDILSQAIAEKSESKLKELFANLKDKDGEEHNIDFDLVEGFELRK